MTEGLIDRIVKYIDPRSVLEEWKKISQCPEHIPIEGKSNIENIIIRIYNGFDIPDGVQAQCSFCNRIYQRPYNLEEKKRIAEVYDKLQEKNLNEYRR